MKPSESVLATLTSPNGYTYQLFIDWQEVENMANRANNSKGKKCRDGALTVKVAK